MAQVEVEKLSASVEPFKEAKVKPDDHLQGGCSNTCCDEKKTGKLMSVFDVVKAGLVTHFSTPTQVQSLI